jgi:hypothetical protein
VIVPLALFIATTPSFSFIDYHSTRILQVRASSPYPVTYQWQLNGNGIPGATNEGFAVTNITEASRGSYSVVVSDGVTTRALSAPLDAIQPVFTEQPQSLKARLGSTVMLSASAKGVPPLAYQWYRLSGGRFPIAGATNTILVLTNVQLADAVGYFVDVISEGRTDQERWSANCALTLESDPLVGPLLQGSVFAATTFQFKFATAVGRSYVVEFSPDADPTKSWEVVQTVTGTGSIVPITFPAATAQGYYRVRLL